MKSILIADDSPVARTFVIRCLEISGCRGALFLEAENGSTALECALERHPDLIVTDLNMPVMNGDELLKSIRTHRELARTPVMVISSAANAARAAELRSLGASAVLGKPVSPITIKTALSELEIPAGWAQS